MSFTIILYLPTLQKPNLWYIPNGRLALHQLIHPINWVKLVQNADGLCRSLTHLRIQVERQPHSTAKQHSSKPSSVTFEDFQKGYNERERRQYLASLTFSYMVQKHSVLNSDTSKVRYSKNLGIFYHQQMKSQVNRKNIQYPQNT